MRTVATGIAHSVICVCALVTTVYPASTAEPMPSGGGRTRVGPGNHVLDADAYGRHLANTIERSMPDVDAGSKSQSLL